MATHENLFGIPRVAQTDIDLIENKGLTPDEHFKLRKENPILYDFVARTLEGIAPQNLVLKGRFLELLGVTLKASESASNRELLELAHGAVAAQEVLLPPTDME